MFQYNIICFFSLWIQDTQCTYTKIRNQDVQKMYMGSSERLMHVQFTSCVQRVISKCRSNFYGMNGFPKLSSDLCMQVLRSPFNSILLLYFQVSNDRKIEGKQNIGLPRVRKLFLTLMLLQLSLRFPNKLTLPLFLGN